jgi:hypothetical protein
MARMKSESVGRSSSPAEALAVAGVVEVVDGRWIQIPIRPVAAAAQEIAHLRREPAADCHAAVDRPERADVHAGVAEGLARFVEP